MSLLQNSMSVPTRAQDTILSTDKPAISRLPAELLGEIFELSAVPCTTTTSKANQTIETRPHTSFALSSSPMNLTHVNQRWRTVSTNLQSLWSTLLLHGVTQYHPLLLRLWLERSGSSHLSIELHTWRYCKDRYDSAGWSVGLATSENSLEGPCTCGFPCPMHDSRRVPALLDILVEHAYRWSHVAFHFTMHEPTALLQLKPGSLKALRSVSFLHNDLFTLSLEPTEVDCISNHERTFWSAVSWPNATPLARLIHQGPLPTSFPEGQWKTMTSLYLSNPTDLTFLSLCSSLQVLHLPGNITSEIPQVTLPNLIELSACCSLQQLTTPSLKTLEITICGALSHQFAALASWIGASDMRHLHTLQLRVSPWATYYSKGESTTGTSEQLLELIMLPTLRSLRRLAIMDYDVPSCLLSLLCHSPFPHLRYLNLHCPSTLEIEKFLIQVVRAHQSLMHFEVAFNREWVVEKQTFKESPKLEALAAACSGMTFITSLK